MPKFADVLLTIPSSEGFTYGIPTSLRKAIMPGVQVIVPFSRRYVSGIVTGVTDKPAEDIKKDKIKEIIDLVDPDPLVSQELMNLLEWISEYYICHLGEAYRLIQSHINVSKSRLQIIRLINPLPSSLSEEQQKMLGSIPDQRPIALDSWRKKFTGKPLYTIVSEWEKKGWIRSEFSAVEKKKVYLTETFFKRVGQGADLTEVQQKYMAQIKKKNTMGWKAYQHLSHEEWISKSTMKSAGFSGNIVQNLVKRGLIIRTDEQRDRLVSSGYQEKIDKVDLTREQQEIIEGIRPALEEATFQSFLLHGITGSGKTQIYVELIKEVLAQNRTAIVLIPEIILTPQTLGRFQFYFRDQIGIIHSRLSAGEKREILHKIRSGKYPVVLGARSAVFAPLDRLGLIIVDEEHETSYKQSEAQPRYHARDVAIYRARLNNAVVVLGSATPSFESLYNVKQGHYRYFLLGKRISARKLPRIGIIDLKEEWKKGRDFPVISESMELKIESRLLTREQVMILQNRRGYSPYIICQECGYVAKCPDCDLTLTYHQKNHQLICHYCNYQKKAPDLCPQCQGMDILYRGVGTQRLEETLQKKFEELRLLRMDQDTTRGKHAHMEILEKFRRGDADVLLGTKMIAKGLDFEKVTLVGIVSADQGLHFPDFRASEKVFQLLTQAAGRAGRGSSSGEVVVQTLDPSHFMFRYLITHDYSGFYEKEEQSRKNLKYPPYSRLILVRIEGKDENEVQKYGEYLAKFFWKAQQKNRYVVLGPAPCPIYKIQKNYRYQILIKQDKQLDGSMSYLRKLIRETFLKKNTIKKWPVKVSIDVDPVEIL